MYTDNPLAAFAAHDFEQQKELEKLSRCVCCDERITDEYCYMVNDEPICEDCMNRYYRVSVDDII